MKQSLGLLLAAAITVTAAANTPAPAAKQHPIVGTWSFPVPGRQCAETYHFHADGTSLVTSGEEVAESAYRISDHPSPSGFYEMTDTVTKDNGKKDCTGEITEVGSKATNYLRFDAKDQMMIMCQHESLDACIGPFQRIHE